MPMRRPLTQHEHAVLSAFEAGPYAVSLSGELARVVPVLPCVPCGLTLPTDHHCEADLKVSLEWTTPTRTEA